MYQCTNCGANIPEGQAACPNCGAPTGNFAPNTAPQPQPQPVYYTNPSQPQPQPQQPPNGYYQQPQGGGFNQPPYPGAPGSQLPPPPTAAMRQKKSRAPLVIFLVIISLLVVVYFAFLGFGMFLAITQSGATETFWEEFSKEYNRYSDEDNFTYSMPELKNPSSLPAFGSESGSTDYFDSESIGKSNNQFFAPAPEYTYLGKAFLLDSDNLLRDAYIPYGEDTHFLADIVRSKNHGVSIEVTLTKDFANAKEALENVNNYSFDFFDENIDSSSIADLGISTMDNDTVGLRVWVAKSADANGNPAYAMDIVYADIRDNGYYMMAVIQVNTLEFDDSTSALMDEVNDAYALTIPSTIADIEAYYNSNAAK